MHQVAHTVSLEDFRTVLHTVDQAFPGIPGAPASTGRRRASQAIKYFFVCLPLCIALLCMLLMSFTEAPIRFWQVVLVFVCALFAGVLLQWEAQDHIPLRIIKGYVSGKPSTFRLTEAGFEMHRGASSTFTPWQAYGEIRIAGDFVYFYRDGAADFVPVAAFADETSMIEFIQFASARVAAQRVDAQPRSSEPDVAAGESAGPMLRKSDSGEE